MTLEQTIEKWQSLILEHASSHESVRKLHPKWIETDPRVAIFGLPSNALISALITFKLMHSNLTSQNWWLRNVPNIPKDNIQHQMDQFVIHNKIMSFILYFSFFEAEFRRIFLLVHPGECSNGTDSFANIYGKLLKTLDLQSHSECIDLARETRNLIHNNGRYLNKNQTDKSLVYRGQRFAFVNGRKVDFAFQDLLFDITDDLLALSRSVVSAEPVETADFQMLPEGMRQ